MGFRSIAGIAGILTGLIGVALVFFPATGPYPTPTTPGAQVAAYYAQNSTTITIQALGSELIFALILLYGLGVFVTLRESERQRGEGWALMGVLAGTALTATYTVAAAIQVALVHRVGALAGQDALVLIANDVQTLLYSIGALFLGVYVVGLSLGGQRSRTMPTWLSAIGYVTGVLALGGVVSAFAPGLSLDFTFYLASLGFLVWTFIGGIRLVRPMTVTRAVTAARPAS